MIARFTSYPSMKDSGVPWLGAVPEHWDILPLCAVGTVKSIRGVVERELLSVYLHRGVIRFSDVEEKRTNVTSKDLSLYQAVDPGDFVLNNQQAWRGSVGVSTLSGIVSPAYLVLSLSPKLQAGYAGHLFRSRAMVPQYLVCSRGVGSIQRNLYWPHLKRAVCPSPPSPEQSAIVRFLDHADRRIRRYIRAKERLIELLEEQKQVIIHEAVTGQIDVRTGQPYPAYKDSGVEWLGKVPQHWETRRLKWVTRLQRGYDLPADKRVPGPFPVVSSGGIIDTHFESRCAGPGVVMGRYGSTDAVYYLERDFWPHNTSLFVTNFQGNMKKWCYYLLTNITKADHASKSAVPGLDRKDLFQIIVPVPPLAEQMEAAKVIETASRTMTTAIATTERKIAVIREYRTRLIADVVTGKLDVREAAAGLPDVDRRGAKDDPDDGFDGEAGSEAAVWRHGVDEGSSLVPVSDAGRSEVAEGELMTEGRPSE